MQKFLTTASQVSAQPEEVCHLDLIALIALLRVTNLHQGTDFMYVSQNYIS